jgi:hypothetical protein
MIKYEGMQYQIVLRLDGKFYCRIYQHSILCGISTDDYDTEDEAIERAEEIIKGLRLKTDGAK